MWYPLPKHIVEFFVSELRETWLLRGRCGGGGSWNNRNQYNESSVTWDSFVCLTLKKLQSFKQARARQRRMHGTRRKAFVLASRAPKKCSMHCYSLLIENTLKKDWQCHHDMHASKKLQHSHSQRWKHIVCSTM